MECTWVCDENFVITWCDEYACDVFMCGSKDFLVANRHRCISAPEKLAPLARGYDPLS